MQLFARDAFTKAENFGNLIIFVFLLRIDLSEQTPKFLLLVINNFLQIAAAL